MLDLATPGSKSRDIVATIIALGRVLNLTVIAEGVETAAQLDFLKERACNEMQGYFFARPMPHEAIPALLQRARARDKSDTGAVPA